MIKQFLSRLSVMVLAGFSGVAGAHPGLMHHAPASSASAHFFLHALMVLPPAIVVFFLGRVLLQGKSKTAPIRRED